MHSMTSKKDYHSLQCKWFKGGLDQVEHEFKYTEQFKQALSSWKITSRDFLQKQISSPTIAIPILPKIGIRLANFPSLELKERAVATNSFRTYNQTLCFQTFMKSITLLKDFNCMPIQTRHHNLKTVILFFQQTKKTYIQIDIVLQMHNKAAS